MASRKLTQLPTATEVTASDKIYIVDVSDTSESPQGTSKQAVISELPTSGITTLTSTDGSIDIDLTDPNAPDLSVGFTRSVFQFVIEETTSTLVQEINKLGGTISLTNDASFAFSLARTGGDSLTGQLIGMFVPGLQESEGGLPIVYIVSSVIEIGTSISFKFPDGAAIPNTSSINATLILDYYPNGWDA